MLKAKRAWLDTVSRTQLLANARSQFDRSLERHAQNAFAIGNLGYVLFLSGEREEAKKLLQRALSLGGEALYQATIKDIETATVPGDAEFSELLNQIWNEIQATKA